jgi:hypothetical protein
MHFQPIFLGRYRGPARKALRRDFDWADLLAPGIRKHG